MKTKSQILEHKEWCQGEPFENYVHESDAEEAMDEYAKEAIIDYENWKKSMGINWNVHNAHTKAETLHDLYTFNKKK